MPDPVQLEGGQSVSSHRPRLRELLWLILPTAIAGICAAGATMWRLPTQVEIDTFVSQVQVHSSSKTPQVVTEQVHARSIALSRFKEVRLTPDAVWIFNPLKYGIHQNSYPESGWSRVRLPSDRQLVLTPSGQSSDTTVIIQPDSLRSDSLALGSIFTRPGTVIFSIPEPRLLSLEMRGEEQHGTIQLPERFLVLANSCMNGGLTWPYFGASVTLRIQLSKTSPFLQYTADRSGILFQTRFAKDDAVSLLGQSRLAIDRVEFVRAGRLTPQPTTTLDGPGTINYVGEQGEKPVDLRAKDLLLLCKLQKLPCKPQRFDLTEATLTMDDKLHVHLIGTANTLLSGPPGSLVDRRRNLFDVARHNRTLAASFTMIVWLIPTLIAGRKFLREGNDGQKSS
jgi:hypothetical protein